MTNTAVSLLAHPIGFITGAILYAMILILVLQTPRKSVSRNVDGARVTPLRRLSLWTAVLGLLWNVGGLASFLLPAASPGWLHSRAASNGAVCLGLSPGRRGPFISPSRGAPRRRAEPAHPARGRVCLKRRSGRVQRVGRRYREQPSWRSKRSACWLMGFVLLLAVVLVDTVRQQGWDHHAGVVALAIVAAAAIPFSHHQSGEYAWWMELIGHHASLPLAVAILYQDFRFAFGDIFLKRALSLMGLVGIAMGLYAGLGASQLIPAVGAVDPVHGRDPYRIVGRDRVALSLCLSRACRGSSIRRSCDGRITGNSRTTWPKPSCAGTPRKPSWINVVRC